MTTDTSPLKILLIEDDEEDYLITRRLTSRFEHLKVTLGWAKTYESGLDALMRCEHDVALVDYRLGGEDGLDLLRDAHAGGCLIPIIFLTGHGQPGLDVAALQAGASDYLLKDQIDPPLLERTIRYALDHARTLGELRRAAQENSLLAAAIQNSTTGVLITDPNQPDNPIIFVNPAFTAITGYSAPECLGRNCRFLQGPATDPGTVRQIREAIEGGRPFRGLLLNYAQNGTPFWNGLSFSPVFDTENRLSNFIGFINDVTDRVRAEEEVQHSERRFRALIENVQTVLR